MNIILNELHLNAINKDPLDFCYYGWVHQTIYLTNYKKRSLKSTIVIVTSKPTMSMDVWIKFLIVIIVSWFIARPSEAATLLPSSKPTLAHTVRNDRSGLQSYGQRSVRYDAIALRRAKAQRTVCAARRYKPHPVYKKWTKDRVPTKSETALFNANVESRNYRGGKLVAYKKTLIWNQNQHEVIIGTLLGDSSMQTSKCNFSVKFEQKYTQVEYVVHIYEIFEPYVGTGPKMRIIENEYHKNNKYGVSCCFRTYAHIDFKYYENQFYEIDATGTRRKVVPENIHQMLTPKVLGYWFMDDGSKFYEDTYCFNTHGFTKSDQERLVSALKLNFNLDFKLDEDKINPKTNEPFYRLKLVNNPSAFEKLVKPYVLPSFEYKFLKN